MDSQPMTDEHLIDIVDNDWRNDKLPNEDIQLPMNKLPDPEENENQSSLKDQEDKWLDIAIRYTEELNNSIV